MKRLSLCIRYWRWCNNNCTFCFEKNNSFDDMFFKPSKEALDANNALVDKLINEQKYDFFTFKIMGGELFAYPKIAMHLKETIVKFHRYYKEHNLIDFIQNNSNVPETLVVASNLLYQDHSSLDLSLDALMELEDIKSTMMVSYDLVGRFANDAALNLYFKNYKHVFEKYGKVIRPVVSFILSKQNMAALVSKRQTLAKKIFDELYYQMKAPFDMSLLLNDDRINDFKYKTGLLDQFIDLMIEKYPRLLNVYVDTKNYRRYHTDRLTIQGGQIFDEESLYAKKNKMNCLLCPQYLKCHHSYSQISYNAFDCDVKRILEKCERF